MKEIANLSNTLLIQVVVVGNQVRNVLIWLYTEKLHFEKFNYSLVKQNAAILMFLTPRT